MTLPGLKKSKVSGVRPHKLPNTASGKDSFSSKCQDLTQMGNCELPCRAGLIRGLLFQGWERQA